MTAPSSKKRMTPNDATKCCQCTQDATCINLDASKTTVCACRKNHRLCRNCKCWRKCRNKMKSIDTKNPSKPLFSDFCEPTRTSKIPPPSKTKNTPTPTKNTTTKTPNPPDLLTQPGTEGTTAAASYDREFPSLTKPSTTSSPVVETIYKEGVANLKSTPPSTQETVTPLTQPMPESAATPPATPSYKNNNTTSDTPPPAQPSPPSPPAPPGDDRSIVDFKLRTVYGDNVHDDDGTTLAGGIDPATDRNWQLRWKRLVAFPQSHYALPRGKVGQRFLTTLCNELAGVRNRL